MGERCRRRRRARDELRSAPQSSPPFDLAFDPGGVARSIISPSLGQTGLEHAQRPDKCKQVLSREDSPTGIGTPIPAASESN